ncbi:MAG: hypothetical protein JNJ59_14190, partial [Deltaproteobacteria bacterium]|nr:hypothetical protein [Deltaproteobacteria bacterium]
KMRDGDGFEIVDSNGNEHFVESRRIQNQRRDGIAYTLVNLKEGATVTTVEPVPAVIEGEAGGTDH